MANNVAIRPGRGLQGIQGLTGANGTNGLNADMTRLSTTSILIATGSQSFAFTVSSSDLGWLVGTRLRAASAANTANYMEGLVTAVSSTSVTINIDAVGGSGTHADWNIFIAGQPAASSGTVTNTSGALAAHVVVVGNGTNDEKTIVGTGTVGQYLRSGGSSADPAMATPTPSEVGLSNVTNDAQTKAAFVPNTAPSAGQILVGNAGGTAYAPVSASGDATLASTGAVTLANTAVTPGSYTNTNLTVDSKGRITAAANGTSGGSSFPLSVVQEAAFSTTTGNVTSFAITFPKALAASGNTAFLLIACDGSSTVTIPTGWTSDFNQAQASFSRLILCHKATAGETTATVTVSSASSFAVYFIELVGSRTLDTSSTGGQANNIAVSLPAITPTANSVVFGAACFVNSGSIVPYLSNFINPSWRIFANFGGSVNGARSLFGISSTVAATNVSTTPPPIYLTNGSLFSGGGVAFATFSIK